MADCMQETESNVEDKIDDNSTEFTPILSESELSAVIFNSVPRCYPPDRVIECRYTIKSSVKPHSRDWIGLFKVGWQSSREYYTYEWSPMLEIQNGEQGKAIRNRVLFRERYLPRADDEFYQFCYVTDAGDVRGASVPFQIKTKPVDQEDLECCEIEDDDRSSIMLVKNKTAMLEESLARTLEENTVLKASKETMEVDLSNANEKITGLESQKVELTTAVKVGKKRLAQLESVVAQKNQLLEEEKSRRKQVENRANNLKTLQENSERRIDELMMLMEQQRAQTSEVEKNKEKLVVERKQYLDTMTADRQMIDKQQNEIKAKEEELNLLKNRFIEFRTKARAESDDFAEKLEKLTTANGKLQEQLAQSIAENSILKRNLEEESERLTKKVREAHLELRNKDEEVQKLQQEISNYDCIVTLLENSKDEILKDASLEAEIYGKKIEKLLNEGKEKQELVYQLEQELEDVKIQLNQERRKTTALKEDYEPVIRALQDQLDAAKALNQSWCSQSDHNLASLQGQIQKQLEMNMEMASQLDARKAEIRALCDELDACKRQLSQSQAEVQSVHARFTDADIKSQSQREEKEKRGEKRREESNRRVKVKENLQTTITDIQGATARSSKASAMYALQKERNELKRIISASQVDLSSDNLRLKIEELRENYEGLRVLLNTGGVAYGVNFIAWHQFEAKLCKLLWSSSVEFVEQLLESGPVLEMQSVVAELWKAFQG